MRTARTAWYNTKTDEIWHGIRVMIAGCWYGYAEKGRAMLFRTEREAEEKRAELRKRPEFKLTKKRRTKATGRAP